MTRVVLIGNYVVPTTTETYLARAFRENGCIVREIGQDLAHNTGPEAFADLILSGALVGRLDDDPILVAYTRTHNATALAAGWTDTWQKLGAAGIPTCSVHLDRFWDLEREHLVWDHDPLFTVAHAFTADGGNDDRWAAAGINHHWLPPAVDREEAEADLSAIVVRDVPPIIFAGSGSYRYHRAYGERGELLHHLNTNYGRRFGHYGHDGNRPVVRGPALNAIYRAAKVVVGDSCFANRPYNGEQRNLADRYWSDRIPETLGRGGLLLHPLVPGLYEAFGGRVNTYDPGDWRDLDNRIEYFMNLDPDVAAATARAGREEVLSGHTYTHRMADVLRTVGLPAGPVVEESTV